MLSFFLKISLVLLLAPARWPVELRPVGHEVPPLHYYVVIVDLTDPRVSLRVCPGEPDPDGPSGKWHTALQTVRTVADREHLDVAINGNFFSTRETHQFGGRKISYFAGNWARLAGWAMSDGVLFGDQPSGASLVVDRDGRVRIGSFIEGLPPGTTQAVSGLEMLVSDGRANANDKERAPRTAVGIDKDGQKLVIMVVDGRRSDWSEGMTSVDLAREMMRLGCHDAMQLDGGGSATLAMRQPEDDAARLISRPSDGHDLPISLSIERPVACILGVKVDRN
ncbi:MAG: phosphodiester glycosidase family protein [Tepidisphaeraceae bacterium]